MIGSIMEVDPDNIRQSDMDRLADAIETYLQEFESVIILHKTCWRITVMR